MFYNQLLIDFHCAQQFQVYEDNAPFRAPWILFWEQPASSISFSFCSCRTEYRYWPKHSVQRWLQTERCRWMSLQQPVQRENPQCSLTSHLADMSTDVQSGEVQSVSAFLGIMLGPAIGHEKSPSDCSLERYRKPGSLAGMVRAQAFQWNHKWYGYRAKQRQAVKTYACTVLISACWLYCTSSAKLKKCLEQAWNRKDKP